MSVPFNHGYRFHRCHSNIMAATNADLNNKLVHLLDSTGKEIITVDVLGKLEIPRKYHRYV